MNGTDKDIEKEIERTQEQQTLRITMVSRDKKEIERVAHEIYARAKKTNPDNKGPVTLKNNRLIITTRRSPCGNGSNTWDKYTMVIRKKYIDITATYDTFREIAANVSSPGVFIQVVIKG